MRILGLLLLSDRHLPPTIIFCANRILKRQVFLRQNLTTVNG
jgi:hypothetical protein